MTIKLTHILIVVSAAITLGASGALCVEKSPKVVEETRIIMGTSVRIQVPVIAGQNDAGMSAAIDKAFKEGAAIGLENVSIGQAIDRIVAALKEGGVNNAFINSDKEIYCLGMRSDKEMWKAWIPHPTDKKKIFAALKLKDKAIVTVTNNAASASVVADDTSGAEKLAKDLLAQGDDGLKSADSRGIDALLIVKDGEKLKVGMAGGFKEQYGKAKK